MIKATHKNTKTGLLSTLITIKHFINSEDIKNVIFDMLSTKEENISRKGVEKFIKEKLEYRGSDYFNYYDDSFCKWDDDFKSNKERSVEIFNELFNDFKSN